MNRNENWLALLGEILDRLGPGAVLMIDSTWLEPLFTFDIGLGSHGNGVMRAQQFARTHDCGFDYEPERKCGTFSRAYFLAARPADTYDRQSAM